MQFRFKGVWSFDDAQLLMRTFRVVPDNYVMDACRYTDEKYVLNISRGSGLYTIEASRLTEEELKMHRGTMLELFRTTSLMQTEAPKNFGLMDFITMRSRDYEIEGMAKDKIEQGAERMIAQEEETIKRAGQEPHPEDFVARPIILVKDGVIQEA